MTNDVVWVTGATSGMGRASALLLAAGGHPVALSGRREAELETLRAEIEAAGGRALAVPLDVSDTAATFAAVARIQSELGPIATAVFSAGLNVKDRFWNTMHLDEFEAVVDTNLTAVAKGAAAVLPSMRERGGGQLVVISSWAGWAHSATAGVAYSASKTGLGSLVKTLNAAEGNNGIRACHLCPGDVDTPFLQSRPSVPDSDARIRMLTPDDIARAVAFVVDSPQHVCINELVISPTIPPPA